MTKLYIQPYMGAETRERFKREFRFFLKYAYAGRYLNSIEIEFSRCNHWILPSLVHNVSIIENMYVVY